MGLLGETKHRTLSSLIIAGQTYYEHNRTKLKRPTKSILTSQSEHSEITGMAGCLNPALATHNHDIIIILLQHQHHHHPSTKQTKMPENPDDLPSSSSVNKNLGRYVPAWPSSPDN